MKALVLSVLLVGAADAQDIFLEGAEVFRKSCAQGYCHGTAGAQGRAPRLTGRVYEQAAVTKIIHEGVPNTGMPGFARQLPAQQLEAVVAYVVKISGGVYVARTGVSAVGTDVMPADAQKGKQVFFDAVRGVNRCGTCHMVEGIGTPVGPNLATAAPTNDSVTIAAIRRGRGAGIRLASMPGMEPFPALVVDQSGDSFRLYDLTSPPPVLRTVLKSEVKLAGGAIWSHSDAVKNYSDSELASIAAYLRWLAAQ